MAVRIVEDEPQLGFPIQRSSHEKVAILLATLENTLAVDLLKKFDAQDVKRILESTAKLGPLTSGDVVPLVDEFADQFSEALGISAGHEQLLRLLESAFTPDEILDFLGKSKTTAKAFSWSRLVLGMEERLVPYLLDEHPQTAAFILSRVSPDLAARCLEILPSDLKTTVTTRMIKLGDARPRVLEILERVLQEDVLGEKVSANDNGRLDKLASIINRLDRRDADAILMEVTKVNAEDGAKLRKLIFMFEDIAKLSISHRAKLLDRVPTDLVIAALFGAAMELREAFLSSLSARTRRMVESELPADQGQPRKDTVDSRRKIAELAIASAKAGDISLPDADAIVASEAK